MFVLFGDSKSDLAMNQNQGFDWPTRGVWMLHLFERSATVRIKRGAPN
jgi:hypothetical protein